MTHREDEYDYLFKGKWTKGRIFFFAALPLSQPPASANHLCEQVSPDADM